jgi:CheY-like chemotaxis protein
MDRTLALFIIAVLVLALIAVLLIRAQNRNGGAQASLSLGDLFKADVRIDSANTKSVDEAIRQAAKELGKPVPPSVADSAPAFTRLTRVLWVDDNPDANLYETIALERLGRLVTKATSTEAAERYLRALDFDLIITNLGRGRERQAGRELIVRVRANGGKLPIIVYTVDAEPKRRALLAAGANAVVDLPDELVRAVDAHLAAAPSRAAAASQQ